jgi:hypothetical protein
MPPLIGIEVDVVVICSFQLRMCLYALNLDEIEFIDLQPFTFLFLCRVADALSDYLEYLLHG